MYFHSVLMSRKFKYVQVKAFNKVTKQKKKKVKESVDSTNQQKKGHTVVNMNKPTCEKCTQAYFPEVT